jgi:hypothetical protein
MDGQGATMGEAGVPRDDHYYAGDVSTSPVSLDYFREKAREFQVTLNALDETYRAAVGAVSSAGASLPPEQRSALEALIDEYQSRRLWLKGIAEAMNLAASVVNSMGGRAPVLSIPQTLGLPAVALPAVYAGAVAAAVIAIEWATGFIQRGYATLASIADLRSLPDSDRAAVVTARDQARNALLNANSTGIGAIAPWLKWGVIVVAGFFVWRAVAPALRR